MSRKEWLLRQASVAALVAVASMTGLMSSPVWGDTADTVAPASDSGVSADGGLEEIVVTAQKRAENVQAVPISISAFSGKFLTNSDEVSTANDIAQFVPNFSAAATDSRERPRWFLNGVGTNNTAANTVSPVGVYIDEVYIANVYAQDFPTYDLERVEVLNGPQGTLWGKNTTGGAISYITKPPSFDFGGYAKLSFGSYNEIDEQGAVGGSLIDDKLAGRVSFYSQKYDGWVQNLNGGPDLGKAHDLAGRIALLATPTDDLTIQLTTHIRSYAGDAYPFEYRPDYNYAAPRNFGYADGGANAYGVKNSAQTGTDGIDDKGGALKINWQPGDLTVTSITGYEYNDRTVNTFGSASLPINNAVAYSVTPDQEWSEELRVASPREDQFNWIGGLYWFDEANTNDVFAGNTNANEGVPTTSGAYTPLSWNETYAFTKTQSYSAFASGTYNFTDQFYLTLGGRLGLESKDYDLRYTYASQAKQIAGVPYISGVNFDNTSEWWLPNSVSGLHGSSLVTASNLANSHTWRYFTWDATPTYKITDNALAYFRYAKGFLSGGFASTTSGSAAAGNIAAQIQPYEPEHIDTYELGVKTSWLDRRLIVNASAFYYDYSSIQVLVIVPSTTINGVNNTGTAGGYQNAAGTVKGLNLTVDAAPLERLHFQGALGLLDTRYTYYPLTSVPTLPINLPYNYLAIGGGKYAVNPIGGAFSRSPNETLDLDLDYTIPLNWGGSVRLAVDYNWRSHQYFNPTFEQDATLQQPAYGLVNAHANWFVDDAEKYEISANLLNALDQRYLDHAIAPSNGVSAVQQGKPRTWFVSLTAKF